MSMRLFIGIKIVPSEELLNIYQEIKDFFKNENISWVTNENLHITLKFIGDVDEKQIIQIKEIISKTIFNINSFPIEIRNIGTFEKNNQLNVIWMGITNHEQLNSIAKKLTQNLEVIGINDNENEYQAHLTIGKVNSTTNQTKIKALIVNYSNQLIQEVIVGNIILFESKKTRFGIHYITNQNYLLIDEFQE